MKKQQLFDLTKRLSEITGGKIPIICGTQSFFAYAELVPDIVSRSTECDYLLLDLDRETRNKILDELGLDSEFRVKNGYYADPLGLFTVVLPKDWQKRLQELRDENDNLIAYCVEIYDTAVSKLIAGREKDFVFLKILLENETITAPKFAERIALLKEMPQATVVASRVASLAEVLKKSRSFVDIQPLKNIAKIFE